MERGKNIYAKCFFSVSVFYSVWMPRRAWLFEESTRNKSTYLYVQCLLQLNFASMYKWYFNVSVKLGNASLTCVKLKPDNCLGTWGGWWVQWDWITFCRWRPEFVWNYWVEECFWEAIIVRIAMQTDVWRVHSWQV